MAGREVFKALIDTSLTGFTCTADGNSWAQRPDPGGKGGWLVELDRTAGIWHDRQSISPL